MLRQLATPRWAVLTLLTLIGVAAMATLSWWQYDRAQQVRESEAAGLAQPVPLDQAVPRGEVVNGEDVGRPVTVAGQWDSESSLLVENRSWAGVAGLWAVAVIRLADGTGQLVVRGWVPSPTDPALALPAGAVAIRGFVQANEAYYDGVVPQTGTRLAQVDSEAIASSFDYPLRDGFVVLAEQRPALPPAPTPIDPPVPAGTSVTPPLQNTFYALQWLVFAGFAIALWVKAFRDESRDRAEEQAVADQQNYAARLPSDS